MRGNRGVSTCQWCSPYCSLAFRDGWWPPYQENNGGFPPLYSEADHGKSTSETIQCNLSVPPSGRGDARGGVVGNLNVHFHQAEQSGPLNSN